MTEIYDYLRLLFARIGVPHCPKCGRQIQSQSIDQIVEQIMRLPTGTKFSVLAPIVKDQKGEHRKILEKLRADGFVRVRVDGDVKNLDEEIKLNKKVKHSIEAVIDRLVMKDGLRTR